MNRRIVFVSLAAWVLTMLSAWAWSAPFMPGTVLVSRNADEAQNTSPGYWNHMAICVGADVIVESQEGRGVVRTPLAEFMARPYSRILALKPRDLATGERAAQRAETLVGLPHAPLSSVWRWHGPLRLRLGLNCVSVIEIAYRLPAINLPDRSLECPQTFQPPEAVR